MDMAIFFTLLVFIIIVLGALAVIIIVIETIFDSPKHLGDSAMHVMSDELHRFDRHEYTIIDDVHLLLGEDIVQIDNIVVSTYGIFIIEANAHAGDIYGKPSLNKWTQTIGYHEKYKMSNPVKTVQHLERALHKLIGDQLKGEIVPFVAFPFAKQLNVDQRDMIGKPWQVIEKLRSFDTEIYNHAERMSIVETIKTANIVDPKILEDYKTSLKMNAI